MVHFGYGPFWLWVTRIILRPLSVLSLDEAKRNITTGLFGLWDETSDSDCTMLINKQSQETRTVNVTQQYPTLFFFLHTLIAGHLYFRFLFKI